jgi:hypothetical protein
MVDFSLSGKGLLYNKGHADQLDVEGYDPGYSMIVCSFVIERM